MRVRETLQFCHRRALLWLAALLLSGCAGNTAQPPWGSRVDLTPAWNRLPGAAVSALKEPLTWAPATAALFCSLGETDRELSDWARQEQPLFGSAAEQVSDGLLIGLGGLYLGSGLAADSGDDAVWRRHKLAGFGLGGAANLATLGITSGLKASTRRERPDGSDRKSLPSGHSSLAAVNAALVSDNLKATSVSPQAATLLRGTSYALAWGTAWARVEAGKHFPSDILAGLALGNFVAEVATNWLQFTEKDAPQLALQFGGERVQVDLRFSF